MDANPDLKFAFYRSIQGQEKVSILIKLLHTYLETLDELFLKRLKDGILDFERKEEEHDGAYSLLQHLMDGTGEISQDEVRQAAHYCNTLWRQDPAGHGLVNPYTETALRALATCRREGAIRELKNTDPSGYYNFIPAFCYHYHQARRSTTGPVDLKEVLKSLYYSAFLDLKMPILHKGVSCLQFAFKPLSLFTSRFIEQINTILNAYDKTIQGLKLLLEEVKRTMPDHPGTSWSSSQPNKLLLYTSVNSVDANFDIASLVGHHPAILDNHIRRSNIDSPLTLQLEKAQEMRAILSDCYDFFNRDDLNGRQPQPKRKVSE